MATFHDLTTAQLKQAVQIREQIESLQEKLGALLGGDAPTKKGVRSTGKRTMSAATKTKMAAAQQARWAKLKGSSVATASKKAAPTKQKAAAAPKKRVFSAATKAKLAAAMKARWAARKKGAPAPNASAN